MKPIEEVIVQVLQTATKFIVVTGGVCSGLGKGVLISSIGTLLKNTGSLVSVVKWDPYLNVDPGTMSPLVHGEVFVTDDGVETDLDLGHYERTLGTHLTRESSVSSGQIFKEILDGERDGVFLGQNIQLVPHVVDAIKRRLLMFALTKKVDFVLVEIGGTVGDIEGEIFLEAVRQLRYQLEESRLMYCHLSYVPFLQWGQEVKTKPTQHSIMLLKKSGIKPDALFLRVDQKIDSMPLQKLSLMCSIPHQFIFQVPTVAPIYNLFLDLRSQELHHRIQDFFKLPHKESDLSQWENLITNILHKKPVVKIGLIAKYVGSNDPYISVFEALKSAAWASGRDPQIITIDAQALEEAARVDEGMRNLESCGGIVIPGGFDKRGIEGKIAAVKWARTHKIPLFGLCLGMQLILIEIARHCAHLKGASSTEFDKATPHPIITLLSEQEGVVKRGATMRLGAYPCTLVKNTIAARAYGVSEVKERHRHRYEFNNKYTSQLEAVGVVFSGHFVEKNLVEIAEFAPHPFLLGTQFHPEFLSSPLKPHPLFKAFIGAIIKNERLI